MSQGYSRETTRRTKRSKTAWCVAVRNVSANIKLTLKARNAADAESNVMRHVRRVDNVCGRNEIVMSRVQAFDPILCHRRRRETLASLSHFTYIRIRFLEMIVARSRLVLSPWSMEMEYADFLLDYSFNAATNEGAVGALTGAILTAQPSLQPSEYSFQSPSGARRTGTGPRAPAVPEKLEEDFFLRYFSERLAPWSVTEHSAGR